MRNKKDGFTLVELIVVIAIIAILAAVLVPTFSSVMSRAKRTADIQLMHQINAGLTSGDLDKSQLSKYKPQTSGWEFVYSEERNDVVLVDENGVIVAAWDDGLLKSDASDSGYKPISDTEEPGDDPGEEDEWADAYIVENSLEEENQENLKSKTEIYLSDKVTAIPQGYFKGFDKLERIYIGKGITAIPKDAFSGCTNLREAVIGGKVNAVGNKAFSGCVALKRLELPDSVRSIHYLAFTNCNFEELSLPCAEIELLSEDSPVTTNFTVRNLKITGGEMNAKFGEFGNDLLKKPQAIAVTIIKTTLISKSLFDGVSSSLMVYIDQSSYDSLKGKGFGNVPNENVINVDTGKPFIS